MPPFPSPNVFFVLNHRLWFLRYQTKPKQFLSSTGIHTNPLVNRPCLVVTTQRPAFTAVSLAILLAIISPSGVVKYGLKAVLVFDAMGLSTFSIVSHAAPPRPAA